MRKFISVVARFFAIVFAILFVLTTILAILLTTINRQMFNATIYKNAFSEQNIYERLPEIIGLAVKSTSSYISNPCSQNPLACSIDGASPELQTCLTTALGQAVYEAIGSGRRNPTDAELQLAQPCLDQYGKSQTSGSQSGPWDSGGGNGMPLYMKNLSAADWQAILTILLPPADLKTMTESTLDQLFAYLNGETDTVTIPLDKLKEHLTGTAGQDLILQLINSQPPCTMQNLEQMISGTNNSGLVLCKPPEFVLPFLVSLIQGLLNSATTGIPDKAVLIKPPAAGSPNPGSGPFGADPITTLRTVRLIMRLSPLVPLVFLLLVTLCAVRSVKSWLRWWGIPFFISGIIALGLEISALPALNIAWAKYIVPRIPPYIPPDIADIGQKLVRSIVHTLTEGIVLPAIILLALGLAVWIGTYFIKTKHEPDVPVTQPTPAP